MFSFWIVSKYLKYEQCHLKKEITCLGGETHVPGYTQWNILEGKILEEKSYHIHHCFLLPTSMQFSTFNQASEHFPTEARCLQPEGKVTSQEMKPRKQHNR